MYIDGVEYCNLCGNPITDDGCPNCDSTELSGEELDYMMGFHEDDLRELNFNDDDLQLPDYEPDLDSLAIED